MGQAEFTARGGLVRLGDLALAAPRVDLWRAPTDNDRGGEGQARVWRGLGLHRLVHHTVDCAVHGEQLVVDTAGRAAGQDAAMVGRWTWTAYDSEVLELKPDLTGCPRRHDAAGIRQTAPGMAWGGPSFAPGPLRQALSTSRPGHPAVRVVHFWLELPWQSHRWSCVPSVVEKPGMSRQRPEAGLR